jgi:prophage regulatory protein
MSQRMTTKASITSDRPLLRIIRKPALRDRLGGCSDHHIDDLETREGFPRHIRIGGRSVGWLEHEVDAWIERRMSERIRKAPAPA